MSFKKIIHETNEIIKKGWIPALSNGTGGMGITFEKMLNIKTNTLELPDYDGIEIKTKSINKNGYISLFNATPDSNLFEIKRIQEKYGYPDSKNKKYKVFNMSFYSNQKIYIGKNLLATINVDRKKQKIFLAIIDRNLNLVDSKCSWTFELLKGKVHRKLQKLFLVYGQKKIINNSTYYKYLKYYCYKFHNFNSFLQCIEDGDIRITFKISVIRSGERKGEIKDHGTSFDIKESKIENIYDRFD